MIIIEVILFWFSDFVVWYGGEEFVVILLNMFYVGVFGLVNEICDCIEKVKFFYGGVGVGFYVIVFIGVLILFLVLDICL